MSSITRANAVVPGGTPDQASGGGWLAPSQVNSFGMAPLSAKADDVSFMVSGTLLVLLVPPPEQAMAVTSSPRASLLSTWTVLVQEEGGGRRTCEGVRSRERPDPDRDARGLRSHPPPHKRSPN